MEKVNPYLLSVLKRLGYTKTRVRDHTLHAKRGQDHLIISLSKRGKVTAVTGHVDVYDRTQPFSKHRALKCRFTDELISEFQMAYKNFKKSKS